MSKYPKTKFALEAFIGGITVWGGVKLYNQEPWLAKTLIAVGSGGIILGGYDYLKTTGALAELIPGGYASGKTSKDFNPRELRRGTKVEMEHTTDPKIAQEIAMDHLYEDARYYDKLMQAGL